MAVLCVCGQIIGFDLDSVVCITGGNDRAGAFYVFEVLGLGYFGPNANWRSRDSLIRPMPVEWDVIADGGFAVDIRIRGRRTGLQDDRVQIRVARCHAMGEVESTEVLLRSVTS